LTAFFKVWFRFAIAFAILIADRWSKFWIERNVGAFETISVIPDVFNIVYTRNRGAAFGLLANASEELRGTVLIGLSLIILLGLLFVLWKPASVGMSTQPWLLAALSLVAGGAMGNLYDRITAGSVTDFLQVFIGSYEWPSFNVADSAISVGIVCMLWDSFFSRKKS
jgi:signal peptidase II